MLAKHAGPRRWCVWRSRVFLDQETAARVHHDFSPPSATTKNCTSQKKNTGNLCVRLRHPPGAACRRQIDLDPMAQLNGVFEEDALAWWASAAAHCTRDRSITLACFVYCFSRRSTVFEIMELGCDGGNINRFNLLLFQRHFSSAYGRREVRFKIWKSSAGQCRISSSFDTKLPRLLLTGTSVQPRDCRVRWLCWKVWMQSRKIYKSFVFGCGLCIAEERCWHYAIPCQSFHD